MRPQKYCGSDSFKEAAIDKTDMRTRVHHLFWAPTSVAGLGGPPHH